MWLSLEWVDISFKLSKSLFAQHCWLSNIWKLQNMHVLAQCGHRSCVSKHWIMRFVNDMNIYWYVWHQVFYQQRLILMSISQQSRSHNLCLNFTLRPLDILAFVMMIYVSDDVQTVKDAEWRHMGSIKYIFGYMILISGHFLEHPARRFAFNAPKAFGMFHHNTVIVIVLTNTMFFNLYLVDSVLCCTVNTVIWFDHTIYYSLSKWKVNQLFLAE